MSAAYGCTRGRQPALSMRQGRLGLRLRGGGGYFMISVFAFLFYALPRARPRRSSVRADGRAGFLGSACDRQRPHGCALLRPQPFRPCRYLLLYPQLPSMAYDSSSMFRTSSEQKTHHGLFLASIFAAASSDAASSLSMIHSYSFLFSFLEASTYRPFFSLGILSTISALGMFSSAFSSVSIIAFKRDRLPGPAGWCWLLLLW